MQLNVEVVQVKSETKMSKTGKAYQVLEIAYKDLKEGKFTAKKMTSYADKAVYDSFANAKQGDIFTVTSEKNGEYWEWTAVQQAAPGTTVAPATASKTTTIAPKSTYETPEERARRQVNIAKTSGISNAIALLSVGSKSAPSVADVLKTAQQFTDFILGVEPPKTLAEMESDMDFDLEHLQ